MSKQDEFIKQLYYGDDLFYENTRKDSSKKCELNYEGIDTSIW